MNTHKCLHTRRVSILYTTIPHGTRMLGVHSHILWHHISLLRPSEGEEQPILYTHDTVLWMVPNSNYIRIWREWRNPTCSLGSVWCPSLKKVDPGDGKLRPVIGVILLGDIFDTGSGPPNFPTNLLVYDDTLKV